MVLRAASYLTKSPPPLPQSMISTWASLARISSWPPCRRLRGIAEIKQTALARIAGIGPRQTVGVQFERIAWTRRDAEERLQVMAPLMGQDHVGGGTPWMETDSTRLPRLLVVSAGRRGALRGLGAGALVGVFGTHLADEAAADTPRCKNTGCKSLCTNAVDRYRDAFRCGLAIDGKSVCHTRFCGVRCDKNSDCPSRSVCSKTAKRCCHSETSGALKWTEATA